MNKNITVFTIAILILTSFSSLTVVGDQNNDGSMTVTYEFKTPNIKQINIDETIYDQITIEDAPIYGNPGQPSLPAKGANILLPKGKTVSNILAIPGEEVFLGAEYDIIPIKEPLPLSTTNIDPPILPDPLIYNSDDMYPGIFYSMVGTYDFRGYKILVLIIYPIQYAPNNGGLYYYNNVTISIELSDDNDVETLFRNLEKDKQEIRNKVDNPSIADSYEQTTKTASIENYDLLIITNDELKDSFVRLKIFHDNRGFNTVIKTLSDVNNNSASSIRDFIREQYINNGIEYLLIGGDDDIIPAKHLWVRAWPGSSYVESIPSDLFYSCLDGSFNYDGDNKWGEPDDGENGEDIDLYAELYVGRACVGDVSEVDRFINKTIEYVNTLEPYLDNVLNAGELLWTEDLTWGGNYMDELIDGSSSNGYETIGMPSDVFNISTLYDRDWPTYHWPSSHLIEKINCNNLHIINHLGHCNYGSCMKLGSNAVNQFSNSNYLFIYSQGCNAGGFDQSSDCIAEHLTIKTDHGAFAAIMNARYGWGETGTTNGPSQHFHREFLDAIFGEDTHTLSKANQKSKEDNIWRINGECMRWCCYELNLLGDPTISLKKTIKPEITIDMITSGFGTVTTKIENTGEIEIENIEWNINFESGAIILVGEKTTGNIPILDVENMETIESDMVFGFGRSKIVVTVKCDDTIINKKTANAFIFLFFVIMLPD